MSPTISPIDSLLATIHAPYTNDPSAGATTVFPTHAHQVLSSCIHILGTSILAYCFARRTGTDDLTTRLGWKTVTWTKLCMILIFLDSWIFLAFSGIIVSGVGLSYSEAVCSLGIYSCIFFYAGSKALTYLFLAERVWIVWSATMTRSRARSPVYRVCAVVVAGYAVIFVLLILGRINMIREDGSCIIGLKPFASIPLLAYDLFVNVFLTMMFVWPLYRQNIVNPRLRRVAWKTLLAAAAALTTSSVNMFLLTKLHGKELGWVCLGSCATDVTVNAIVLYWVTTGGDNDNKPDSLPQRGGPLSLRDVSKTFSAVVSPPTPYRKGFGHSVHNDKHFSSIVELNEITKNEATDPSKSESTFTKDPSMTDSQ